MFKNKSKTKSPGWQLCSAGTFHSLPSCPLPCRPPTVPQDVDLRLYLIESDSITGIDSLDNLDVDAENKVGFFRGVVFFAKYFDST